MPPLARSGRRAQVGPSLVRHGRARQPHQEPQPQSPARRPGGASRFGAAGVRYRRWLEGACGSRRRSRCCGDSGPRHPRSAGRRGSVAVHDNDLALGPSATRRAVRAGPARIGWPVGLAASGRAL